MKNSFIRITPDTAYFSGEIGVDKEVIVSLVAVRLIEKNESTQGVFNAAKERVEQEKFSLSFSYKHNLQKQYSYSSREARDADFKRVVDLLEELKYLAKEKK